MQYLDIEQGSDAWRMIRLGKVTGSRVADACAKLKRGGWAAVRADYMAELVLERLEVTAPSNYLGRDVELGKIREPDARAEYELRNRCEVRQIGFVDHPAIPMTGASPDGFVGDCGLVEIKCPNQTTHLDYLRAGIVPDEYAPQIVWNFACNPTRQWCDFVSYNPDFPPQMELFQIRMLRDDAKIADTEMMVRAFLKELDEQVADLRTLYIERKSPLLKKLQESAAS